MKTIRLFLFAGVLGLMASCASITKEGPMKQPINSIQDLNKLETPTHDISMYPEAKEGQERVLIHLPALKEEGNYEIELFVGKWENVDCNQHSLIGSMEEETVNGWGYTYFQFESKGEMISTMMACPDQDLERKLVQAKSTKVRYNSKLPIVVYIPEGFTVSYKLWNSLGETIVE